MIEMTPFSTIKTVVKANNYRSNGGCGAILVKPDKDTYSGTNDAYIEFTNQNTSTSAYTIVDLDVSSLSTTDYVCLRTFKSSSMYVEALVGVA